MCWAVKLGSGKEPQFTMVSVKFLGCGDNFGSGGRFQTCISVQSEAANFLIDCGASAWTDNLIKIASGVDLFIAEAYFYEKK